PPLDEVPRALLDWIVNPLADVAPHAPDAVGRPVPHVRADDRPGARIYPLIEPGGPIVLVVAPGIGAAIEATTGLFPLAPLRDVPPHVDAVTVPDLEGKARKDGLLRLRAHAGEELLPLTDAGIFLLDPFLDPAAKVILQRPLLLLADGLRIGIDEL